MERPFLREGFRRKMRRRKLTHLDFLSRLRIERNGCWVYTGPLNSGGYGKFGHDVMAHIYAYTHWVGPVPEGMQIDHLCRVRSCCNPKHLEVVTARTNTLRGEGLAARNARKTHCPQGHEYTPENTLLKGRRRHCRTCDRARCREYGHRVRSKKGAKARP